MRVLFDQGTPLGIRNSLQAHSVRTAYEEGWSTLSNGELLGAAEDAGFEVFVTTDKNLVYQQNLASRKIAIVVLGLSRWRFIHPILPRIAKAIDEERPGTYKLITVPEE